MTLTPRLITTGYTLVLGVVLFQAFSTIFQASLGLHDSQQLQVLQRQKQQLEIIHAELAHQVASQTAIKPIQLTLATEFTPITKFLTASQHTSVAWR
ncbi:MAG TPA: hypothetical protein DEP87_04785 [Candidatus Pacebacteria bacterium]|nr:hypothetical protein [Candidatus Paceibacterota bacterium]